MIDLPYTDFELRCAFIGLESKLTPEVKERFEATFKDLPPFDFKIASIAKFHDITVEQFLMSPNAELLKSMYNNHYIQLAINTFEGLGFSNKEACAIIASVTGVLK